MVKPEIRLKGFEGEWEDVCFKDISYPAGEKNRDNLPLESYSISNEFGFVPQNEQFEKGGTMANADKRMYYIVKPDSFAYNPARINVGSIGYDNLDKDVIVSSLYVIFKTDSETNNEWLNIWFKTPYFKRLVELYQEGGVRLYFFYDKLCACHLNRPLLLEQKAIADYFKSLDSMLQSTTKKIESLKQVKQACLVSMFPQAGETTPRVRFNGFEGEWNCVNFGSIITECFDKTTSEDEDVLLSSAIDGLYLNSELFSHFRGQSNIGYRKVKKNMLILSAQNLHLGNANVNLRFEHGIVSPAYKIYYIHDCNAELLSHWIKREETKDFFLNATTSGASVCRKNIVWDDLYKQKLFIPKEDKEQRMIASFFTSLDKQISLQEQRLEKLKQIKAACLDKMFV